MTPCDNETVANVDDFPVVDLECSQPLSNGASAFVGENSEKRACILEATSIDTEDVTDLSCSQFWQHTCKDITAYRYVQKGNTSFGFICPLQRALWEENMNAGLKFFTLWTMQPWSLYWKKDVPDFINETVKSKTWSTTFGLSPKLSDATSNPTIQALIKAYDESGNKKASCWSESKDRHRKFSEEFPNKPNRRVYFRPVQTLNWCCEINWLSHLLCRWMTSIVVNCGNGLPLQIAAGTVWLLSKHSDSSQSSLYFIWACWNTTF